MSSKQLPAKLNKDTILQCILEIRFDSQIPSEAVFGAIYQALSKDLTKPKTVTLPVASMPAEVKDADPNLRYLPCWQIVDDLFTISISSHSISFSIQQPYCGWKAFYDKVKKWIQAIIGQDIIQRVCRIGLRYINTFDENLFASTNLSVSANRTPISNTIPLNLRFVESSDICNLICFLGNKVDININGNLTKKTILDIDAFYDSQLSKTSFKKEFENCIYLLHLEEKKKFFSFLTEDFLAALEPEY